MGRRIVLDSDRANAEFEQLFADVQQSWFRLETLQNYDMHSDRDAIPTFLRGESVRELPASYFTITEQHVAAGRTLSRVHVVEEPHTDYMRYELAQYAQNVAAGEEVRIASVARGEWPSKLPRAHDYWLFDDRDLWLMEYDDEHRLLAVELTNDPAALAQHRSWRDAALAVSIPYADYTARLAGFAGNL